DEDDGEEDSDEYEVETMPEQDDGLDDLEGLPIGNGQADGEVDPRARAARWFSNPMFEDVEAEEQAIQLGKRKGKAQVNGDADMESSEDEEEVDEESEGEEEVEGEEVETSEDDEDYEPEDEDMEASASEAEEGDSEESEEEQDDSYGNIPLPLLTAEKKKALLERKSKQQAENLKRLAATGIVDFEQEDLPDPESFADLLKDISKSDRDRREARKKAKADAEMEIVAAEFDKEFTGGASNPGKYTEDGGSDSEGLTEEQLAAKRELIEAGMGRVIKGKKQQQQQRANGSGKFEVVKRGQELEEGDSDSSMDNEEDDAASLSEDPRNQEFDLETQAELLALGRQLKRHTTAKQLVDARYGGIIAPLFVHKEEAQHFRPQLPITKDEVEKIKERFRDIAAAPIKKVAEARARKKMKAKRRMDKAKRKAEAIVSQEDRSE
ncbi:SPB1, partial [Symbiodinium sp. KB8]